jgi:hypothetical protein
LCFFLKSFAVAGTISPFFRPYLRRQDRFLNRSSHTPQRGVDYREYDQEAVTFEE